jgi:hypothetical protein
MGKLSESRHNAWNRVGSILDATDLAEQTEVEQRLRTQVRELKARIRSRLAMSESGPNSTGSSPAPGARGVDHRTYGPWLQATIMLGGGVCFVSSVAILAAGATLSTLLTRNRKPGVPTDI